MMLDGKFGPLERMDNGKVRSVFLDEFKGLFSSSLDTLRRKSKGVTSVGSDDATGGQAVGPRCLTAAGTVADTGRDRGRLRRGPTRPGSVQPRAVRAHGRRQEHRCSTPSSASTWPPPASAPRSRSRRTCTATRRPASASSTPRAWNWAAGWPTSCGSSATSSTPTGSVRSAISCTSSGTACGPATAASNWPKPTSSAKSPRSGFR